MGSDTWPIIGYLAAVGEFPSGFYYVGRRMAE